MADLIKEQRRLLFGRCRIEIHQPSPHARKLLVTDDSAQAPDRCLFNSNWAWMLLNGLRSASHKPDIRQVRPTTLSKRLDQVHNGLSTFDLFPLQISKR